jgi:hypothetical protein
MMLLRRAHREVYRVYGEEDFLAGADQEERFTAAASGAGERRLRRAAGAAMLVGAVSAVGGLIVLNSLPPVKGTGRRFGSGLRGDTEVLVFAGVSRARVERGQADAGRPVRVRTTGRARQMARARGAKRPGERRRAAAAPAQHVGVQIDATPASVTRLTASASAEPERSERAEFGFER